ncbi:MAG: hypothetical protein H7066_03245, partial [Cytophagaceae bacterium]|nr:hypothetical protein [Gemmatimonadaceae bacterium]
PVLMVARNISAVPLRMVERAIQRSGRGSFSDPRLTDMAKAIESRDAAALAALAERGGVDWSARDRKGRTIFGIAVEEAGLALHDDQQVALLRILVDAGARYQDDALSEKTRIFPDLLDDTGDQHLPLLEVLLAAGANPNATEPNDHRPVLLHYNMTVKKAKLLLAHGADITGARDTRDDRPGWDALMNATYTRNWPLAIFYLEQGFDPRFKAADGKTVRDVLQDVKNEERGAGGGAFAGEYRRFTDALDARLKSTAATPHE